MVNIGGCIWVVTHGFNAKDHLFPQITIIYVSAAKAVKLQ